MGRTMGGRAMCIEGAPLGDDRRKAVCKRSAQRANASGGERDTRPEG